MAPPYPTSRAGYVEHVLGGRKNVFAEGTPNVPPTDERFMSFRFKGVKMVAGGVSRPGVKPEDGLPLRDFLDAVVGIPAQEVEGDDESLKLKVTGDFVLREGRTRARSRRGSRTSCRRSASRT